MSLKDSNLSYTASPLQTLLEKNVEWDWWPEQAKSILSLKELITTAPVLKYFLVGLPSYLLMPVLKVWELSSYRIIIGTCSELSPRANKTMPKLRKKCLPWHLGAPGFTNTFSACLHTIEVETDHKPLEAIFKKPLHLAPAWLQKMIVIALLYQLPPWDVLKEL